MTQKKEPGKTRLELAAKKLAQAKALHDQLLAQKRAKEISANRKLENRKKLLVGAFVLSQFKNKGWGLERLTIGDVSFKGYLKRPDEISLFESDWDKPDPVKKDGGDAVS